MILFDDEGQRNFRKFGNGKSRDTKIDARFFFSYRNDAFTLAFAH